MITLLLALLTAQVSPVPAGDLVLDIAPFQFTRVAASETTLAIADQTGLVVHLFDRKGKLKVTLGKGEHRFQLPHTVSWSRVNGHLYVFDAAERSFSEWSAEGTLIKVHPTDLDLFFLVGPLTAVDTGFVAPTSLTEERYLLSAFDTGFKPVRSNYHIANSELANMSPDMYKTFTAAMKNGNILAVYTAQALSRRVDVFDEELRLLRNFMLEPKGWRDPKMSKLEKVSKNPVELRKYQSKFSEIVALEPLPGERLLVGFRNVADADDFGYQVLDAKSGDVLGDIVPSPGRLAGAVGNTLYLKVPDTKSMVLKVMTVP